MLDLEELRQLRSIAKRPRIVSLINSEIHTLEKVGFPFLIFFAFLFFLSFFLALSFPPPPPKKNVNGYCFSFLLLEYEFPNETCVCVMFSLVALFGVFH